MFASKNGELDSTSKRTPSLIYNDSDIHTKVNLQFYLKHTNQNATDNPCKQCACMLTPKLQQLRCKIMCKHLYSLIQPCIIKPIRQLFKTISNLASGVDSVKSLNIFSKSYQILLQKFPFCTFSFVLNFPLPYREALFLKFSIYLAQNLSHNPEENNT